jgi:transposase
MAIRPGRPSPRYSESFRSDAVALAKTSEKSVPVLARELGIAEQTLRDWVNRAATDAGGGGTGELTSAERTELQRLRREVKTLQMEREILKKAAAFFATESR